VLQEKEVTRLGESTPRRVDVRVITATHQNLDQLVSEGKFRQDLLYRIRVARIAIPPLRERREDIPLLVNSFLSQTAERNHRRVASVSDEAVRRMLQYDWPGNVRELQSAIESACIKCKGSVIRVEDLPPELNAPLIPGASTANAEEDARNHLLAAMRAAKGSRTTAARLLGVSRATLYRRLQELHLDPQSLPHEP
jgi:DNA-binding NtrC family response regulator